MYDAELIETKKKVDKLLCRKEFSYKTGLKEGYLDAVSDLVNKIKETDDFEYAMFSLGFIKEAAEQLIKEMWDIDVKVEKLDGYKMLIPYDVESIEELVSNSYNKGIADAIGEIATRLEEELTMVLPRDKVMFLMYKVHTILEQLKEKQ